MKVLVLDDRTTATISKALLRLATVEQPEGCGRLSHDEIIAFVETRLDAGQDRTHALVVGDPISGLELLGPFERADDATTVAQENYRDQTWWITDLRTIALGDEPAHPAHLPNVPLIALDTRSIEAEIAERIDLGRFQGAPPTRAHINAAIAQTRISQFFYDAFDHLRSEIIDAAVDFRDQEKAR